MELPNFTNPERNVTELGVYEGDVVVDLGAGTGAYTAPLADRVGEAGHVIAVEVQKDFLTNIKDLAREKGLRNVEVVWGDIEHLGGTKLKDASANAVVVSNVLFQVEDKDGLVEEAKRILKPGGKILVVDWKDSFGGLGPSQGMVLSEAQVRALLERHEFFIKKDFSAGEHHYGIVAIKS